MKIIHTSNFGIALEELRNSIVAFQQKQSKPSESTIEVIWNGRNRKVTVKLNKTCKRDGHVKHVDKKTLAYMMVKIAGCTPSEYHEIQRIIKPLHGTNYSEYTRFLKSDNSKSEVATVVESSGEPVRDMTVENAQKAYERAMKLLRRWQKKRRGEHKVDDPQINIKWIGGGNLSLLFTNGCHKDMTERYHASFSLKCEGLSKNMIKSMRKLIREHLNSLPKHSQSTIGFTDNGTTKQFKKKVSKRKEIIGEIRVNKNANHDDINIVGFSGKTRESVSVNMIGSVVNYS